jgi:intein/homing endonuclease
VPGDWVLAQDESDPDAVPTLRQVEEVFENQAQVMVLGLGGREIETTPEHPFWVRDKGWTAAGEIETGEELRSHDGQWIPLDSRYITDNLVTVYNMRVAENHTYFVGSPLWGFSVWAHNSCDILKVSELRGRQMPIEFMGNKIKKYKRQMPSQGGYGNFLPIQVAIVDGKKIIIDGHHRARAAGAAGIKFVPVRIVEVTPEKAK